MSCVVVATAQHLKPPSSRLSRIPRKEDRDCALLIHAINQPDLVPKLTMSSMGVDECRRLGHTMRMEAVSLVVDVGVDRVRAMCRWQNGSIMPLYIDDEPVLPAHVFVDRSGCLLTGAQARSHAVAEPDALIASPLSALSAGSLTVGGHDIDPVDVFAALVERCAGEARAACGQPVTDLCLAVPAPWGPRRQLLLRHAAQRAGFPDPQLVPVPEAAAIYVTRGAGLAVPVDGLLLACDIRRGLLSAAVLHRRTELEWDTLSCICEIGPANRRDGSLGRDRDETADGSNAGDRGPGRHSGTDGEGAGASATVDGRLALDDDAGWRATVLQTIVRAVDAADVDLSALSGLVRVGTSAPLPTLDAAIHDMMGLAVVVPPRPEQAVALGCAYAASNALGVARSAGWAPTPAPDPRMSQIVAVAVSGVGSLLLLVHVVATAYVHHVELYVDYVLLNHGEFAVACLLTIVASMTAARSMVLVRVAALAQRQLPDQSTLPQRILVAAAGVGIAVAVVYALLVALPVQEPAGAFLGTAAWAVVPVAVCGLWIAVILQRLDYLGGTALRQLATPVVPIVLACVGIIAMQTAYSSAWAHGTVDAVARCGGASAAAACAWMLTRGRTTRLVAVPLLAMIGALAASVATASAYGYGFMVCGEVWWLLATVAVTGDAFPRLRVLTWPRRHGQATSQSAGPVPRGRHVTAPAGSLTGPHEPAGDTVVASHTSMMSAEPSEER
jgi:hypothetical protein